MDNQQSLPPMPPLGPSEQPSPPQESFIKKHKKLLLISGLLLVIALIVLLIVLVRQEQQGSPTQSNNQTAKQFKNWLAPTKELKVGEYRYVSACQALSLEDITEQFGELGDAGYISEEFIDESYSNPKKYLGLKASCQYVFSNGKQRDVSLYSEQFVDSIEIKKVYDRVAIQPDKVIAQINELQAGNDAQAKQFVDRLKSSSDKYAGLDRLRYKIEELKLANVDGLVLPNAVGSYVLFMDNGVYEFKIAADKSQKNSAGQLAAYNKLLQRLETNLKNKNLDQSPAPTIIGDSEVVGDSTKVIEACSVLTPGIFSTIAGAPQSDISRRKTLPKDLQLETIGERDGQKSLVNNSCERNNDQSNSANGTDTTFNLTIRHAKSEQDAIKWLSGDEATTPLQTDADQSFILNPLYEGGQEVHYFRVGPYVVDIDIYGTTNNGTISSVKQRDATKEQYIKAINLLVAELKKYQ